LSLKLLGKVAVITGTGGGVGREAALHFAKEGAAVVGCDIDADAAAHTVEMVKYEGGTIVSMHPSDSRTRSTVKPLSTRLSSLLIRSTCCSTMLLSPFSTGSKT
jgi:NAD(P)-dependent dehydrogenase (short-subunit alcohol dehydrogenase family)